MWLYSRVSSVQDRTDFKSRKASVCPGHQGMILFFYFALKDHSCMVTCCTSVMWWWRIIRGSCCWHRYLSSGSWGSAWNVHPGPQGAGAGERLCSSVDLWVMAHVVFSHSVSMPKSTAGILKEDTPSTSCMYNITNTKPHVQTHLWSRWMSPSVDRPVLHKCLIMSEF